MVYARQHTLQLSQNSDETITRACDFGKDRVKIGAGEIMARLTLTFLGSFQATLDGTPIARFQTDKVRALLAYLAVEAERPHSRASLCGLLWPDQSDAAALHNLSQTLLRLREALGDTPGAASFLRSSRQSIQWNAASDHQLDAADFARLAARINTADLEQAAALYGGQFLPGFGLPGCEAFEEWLLLERERFAHLAITALDTLTRAQLAEGRYDQAEQHARRQLALDPWREPAHQQLMQALAAAGQRSAALAQYHHCCELLRAELGVEPDAATTALYAAIKDGSWQPQGSSSSAGLPTTIASLPAQPPPELPTPLTPMLGRDRELARLIDLLTTDGERMVTLAGAGGVGKTRLALAAAHALHQKQPGVYWTALAGVGGHDATSSRSADEVATQLATAIAEALALSLRGDQAVTAQVRAALRGRSVLLVLDNLEHLLAATPWLLDR